MQSKSVLVKKTGRHGRDSLSFAYHSTPAPLRWHDWPDVPTETKHVSKKICFVKPGESLISDPHRRTLALQVYRDILRNEPPTTYKQLVKLIFDGSASTTMHWPVSEGKVFFPNNGTPVAQSESSQGWNPLRLSQTAVADNDPMMVTFLATDTAKAIPLGLFFDTDWSTLTKTSRLTFAAFPSARYLSRVVCHSGAIIGLLYGGGRLAWTTPDIFYSGLDVVRARNRRHSVDHDMVDTNSHRDFHFVDHVQTGTCLYVRGGAAIQLRVEAETTLVMVVDGDVEPNFERLSDWMVRVKGENISFTIMYIL